MGKGAWVFEVAGLGVLLEALWHRGYRVIGPTVRDGAITYGDVRAVDDLPAGRHDEQHPGAYRLHTGADGALLGFAVGPGSLKRFLFEPRTLLWRGLRTDDGFSVEVPSEERQPLAFVGVRPCDLAAVAVQDRVFLGGRPDARYRDRRAGAFIVAVNCSMPGGTCFCTSMGTGPAAGPGADLVLTEIVEGRTFVAEVGTERGEEVLAIVPRRPATSVDLAAVADIVEGAARAIGDPVPDAPRIKELLYRNREHPRWSEVADRCLSCGNCTMVCPTCFCSTVEDRTDLDGVMAERWRTWDSCFVVPFSEFGGHVVRATTKARYRQWLTHKMATWIDQFGTSGCVGCGRCITWCPVGIDIRDEIAAFAASEQGSGEV